VSRPAQSALELDALVANAPVDLLLDLLDTVGDERRILCRLAAEGVVLEPRAEGGEPPRDELPLCPKATEV
jgi:hypothetical protein